MTCQPDIKESSNRPDSTTTFPSYKHDHLYVLLVSTVADFLTIFLFFIGFLTDPRNNASAGGARMPVTRSRQGTIELGQFTPPPDNFGQQERGKCTSYLYMLPVMGCPMPQLTGMARTQENQDQIDVQDHQQAMDTLVQSWKERFSLISLIVSVIFAHGNCVRTCWLTFAFRRRFLLPQKRSSLGIPRRRRVLVAFLLLDRLQTRLLWAHWSYMYLLVRKSHHMPASHANNIVITQQ